MRYQTLREWADEEGYDPADYIDAPHGTCEFCGSPLEEVYVDDSGVVYGYDCTNLECEG